MKKATVFVSCKKLVDHREQVALRSELYISQKVRKADPFYAAIFDAAKFAARFIKQSDERANVVSEAVTIAWLEHVRRPDKPEQEIIDEARRRVYKCEHRLRQRQDHDGGEFLDATSDGDASGDTTVLDGDVSMRSNHQYPDWKKYQVEEDKAISRIDAKKMLVAIYRALAPDEFEFYIQYNRCVRGHETDRIQSILDRQRIFRIRRKLERAKIFVE